MMRIKNSTTPLFISSFVIGLQCRKSIGRQSFNPLRPEAADNPPGIADNPAGVANSSQPPGGTGQPHWRVDYSLLLLLQRFVSLIRSVH